MTPLETKISSLLVDCEHALEPELYVAQQWVIINKTQKRLRPVEDKQASSTFAYGRARAKISALESYAVVKEAFERDKVFVDGKRTAGYWATLDGFLQYLIRCSGRTTKRNISIDYAKALRCVRSFRDVLTSRSLLYEASARLFGVKPTSKSLTLPDGVTLYRLNMRERNEQQPIVLPIFSSGWEDQLLDQPAELRVSVAVPVDPSEENAFFKAPNAARDRANQIFSRILQAILVSTSGRAGLGNIDLKGGIEQMLGGQLISRDFPAPVNIILRVHDISKIRIAYDILSDGKRGDKTLSRALHRYILGRQRIDLVDKLVDYVIAWEAVLLTQGRNPITQELSYRFAVNGASILSTVNKHSNPKENYGRMLSAYSTRSSIVHGGDDRNRDKALQEGNFKNLLELCDFLESNFRRMVFWLSSLKPNDRPYLAQGGWESLIWSPV